MKNLLKLVALVLSLVMVVGCFAACDFGKKEESKDEAGKTVAKNDDGAKKVIKMGTNAAFPPYESKEGDKFVGIDVEIAEAIAAELGYELEIVDMEFDSIITAVNQGEVDFGMAGMTVTEERLEEVDFTVSYATGVQSVIVKEGSSVATLDDLGGKKIGVQLGTTGDYAVEEIEGATAAQYNKGVDAVNDLLNGRVDCVIIDKNPALVFESEYEGIVALPGDQFDFAVEQYAIALPKGDSLLISCFSKSFLMVVTILNVISISVTETYAVTMS